MIFAVQGYAGESLVESLRQEPFPQGSNLKIKFVLSDRFEAQLVSYEIEKAGNGPTEAEDRGFKRLDGKREDRVDAKAFNKDQNEKPEASKASKGTNGRAHAGCTPN